MSVNNALNGGLLVIVRLATGYEMLHIRVQRKMYVVPGEISFMVGLGFRCQHGAQDTIAFPLSAALDHNGVDLCGCVPSSHGDSGPP